MKPQSVQSFLCPKSGKTGQCGDRIVQSADYYAVIDGATPKSGRLWQDLPGDAFVAGVLERSVLRLAPELEAEEAIACLNGAIRAQYEAAGLDAERIPPEEQLQASVVLFSRARKEIWSFGDCMYRVNGQTHQDRKQGDALLAELRCFFIEEAALRGQPPDLQRCDCGREQILPLLKRLCRFANADSAFGYDALNGGALRTERVRVLPVRGGDRVVLASDGYPALFDTLEETERFLAERLKEDPTCTGVLRGTKGLMGGAVSYDDRAYLSFTV